MKKIKELKEVDFKDFIVWEVYDKRIEKRNLNSIFLNLDLFWDLEVKPYFFDPNTEILSTKIQDVIDAYLLVKAQMKYIENSQKITTLGAVLISDLLFENNKDYTFLMPLLFRNNNIAKANPLFLKEIKSINVNINFEIYPYFSNYYFVYLKNEDNTKNFALNLLDLIQKNIKDLGYFSILLTGELGVGKTFFTKTILPLTNSPTFNIMNKFKIQNLNIIHWDLYRISDFNDLEKELDFTQYLQSNNTINIIEWANKIPIEFYIKNIGKNNFIIINIEYVNSEENSRILTLHYNSLLNKLMEFF